MLEALKRSTLHQVARLRTGPLAAVPIPCRLPFGGWYLSYGDEMGLRLLSQSVGLDAYEPAEYRFVARFVRPGTVCLDIGANQGVYTVLLARRSAPGGRVIAFEPIPFLRHRLRRNLAFNLCSNVLVEPLAVGGVDGMAPFYVAGEGKESYSGLRAAVVAVRTRVIDVQVVTLDSYARRANLQRIDFMKIDAEGAELEILSGGQWVFDVARPVVQCEIADVRTAAFGYRAREIIACLQQKTYSWFTATSDGRLKPAAEREIYTTDYEDCIAVPEEKLKSIQYLLATQAPPGQESVSKPII